MDRMDLYRDIAQRTQGDIYIGVVGPVRTGKSTFIKRFIDLLVLPGIDNEHVKARLIDELPQSGSGKSIMTTQPKFVPNEAVELELNGNAGFRVRMVDCVGYLIPDAIGHIENDMPRMVRTPWFDYEIPFEEAAELGTKKVITEHSTIGIVMATDGSITQIARSSYVEAEERVVRELKEQGKPFVIILNTTSPDAEDTIKLRDAMSEKYGVSVLALDALNMTADTAFNIIEQMLMEFPLRMISVCLPSWINALGADHWLSQRIMQAVDGCVSKMNRMKDYHHILEALESIEDFLPAALKKIELGSGEVFMEMQPVDSLFYRVLGEQCGYEIKDDLHLISAMREFVAAKKEFDMISDALKMAHRTGYGMVDPKMEDMALEEPEIVQQGSRFGVKLKAKSSGLHLIRIDVESEVSPLVGTEEQAEEFMAYLLDTFKKDPDQIWQTNIFGKPLFDLIQEGMASKVNRMPEDVRQKLQSTLQRMVNDGCNGLICILL